MKSGFWTPWHSLGPIPLPSWHSGILGYFETSSLKKHIMTSSDVDDDNYSDDEEVVSDMKNIKEW